jgi:glycosyltransferase involved in cell wall biosynthesis
MTHRRPICSVVIPSRDCLAYLPTALASIDMQRIDGMEVIVVDDGSTDGTAEWLAAAPRVQAELRVLSTGGIGPSPARNAAIAAARSDLIAFLDADDVWWPGKLARQLAYHEHNCDVAMSFTDYMHMTPDGRTHGTCFEYWSGEWGEASGVFARIPDAEARLLAHNVVGTSAVVARKVAIESLGGFSPACKSAEDWDLWLRIAARAEIACSRMVGMTYLMRPNGETSARRRRIEAMQEIVARYVDDPRRGIATSVRLARARLTTAEAECLLAEGHDGAAAVRHLRVMLEAPSVRTMKAALAGGARAALALGARRKSAA